MDKHGKASLVCLVRGLDMAPTETEKNVSGWLTCQALGYRTSWPEAAALWLRIELKRRAGSQNKGELATSEDAGTVLYRHLKL